MNPAWWTVLGIAPTEDVRAVKRAYASRLKECRPEDDPQGFARLREAYDAVLGALTNAARHTPRPLEAFSTSPPAPAATLPPRLQPVRGDAAEHAEKPHTESKPMPVPPHNNGGEYVEKPPAPVRPVPVSPRVVAPSQPAAIVRPLAASSGPHHPLPPPIAQRTPRVDTKIAGRSPYELAGVILEEARRLDGGWSGFAAWLHNREELFSIDFKLATSEAVLRRIAVEGAPRRHEAIDVLSAFFAWDDHRTAGQPAQRQILVRQMQHRVACDDFAEWLDAAPHRYHPTARTLRTVRKFGDGKRAWMMASPLLNRRRVLQAFQAVTPKFGEAVLAPVLGDKTIKFWYRALAPLPNRLQLTLTAPLAIVTLILSVALWRLDLGDNAVLLSVLMWVATLTAGAFLFLDYLGLGIRFWNGRCLPVLRVRLQTFAQTLHLRNVPRQIWGATALVALGAVGWWWPLSWPDWPFYAFVALMSFGAFKERRTLYGCALATVGATVLFKLVFFSGKVPFLALPATLWGGRALHEWAARRIPRLHLRAETMVLIVGMVVGVLCLVLTGVHVQPR